MLSGRYLRESQERKERDIKQKKKEYQANYRKKILEKETELNFKETGYRETNAERKNRESHLRKYFEDLLKDRKTYTYLEKRLQIRNLNNFLKKLGLI